MRIDLEKTKYIVREYERESDLGVEKAPLLLLLLLLRRQRSLLVKASVVCGALTATEASPVVCKKRRSVTTKVQLCDMCY